MNCSFLWVQRLIFNEFMAFCKSVINHSVITVSSHLSHPFQYLHYEGTMVNSNTTIAIVSAGLWTQRLQWLAGPLSSTSAPLRACRPLTAIQLLIFSLQPVLCLCLCLFCCAFQYTLLGSSSCITVTILFILRAAWRQSSARLNCYGKFCNLDLKRDSSYRQVINSRNPHHFKTGRSQMLCLHAAYHSVYRAGEHLGDFAQQLGHWEPEIFHTHLSKELLESVVRCSSRRGTNPHCVHLFFSLNKSLRGPNASCIWNGTEEFLSGKDF